MQGEVQGCPYLLLQHPHPKLLWFAHIDVVPGEERQFTLRRDGDRLIGRGAKDMKGAALPFLLAYREHRQRGDALPPISILLTSDEETAGPTIPTLLQQGHLGNVPAAPRTDAERSEGSGAWVAFTPDTGSNPGIVVEHKGVLWADLIAEGKGTHGALPWEGKNPIPLLAEALRRITEAFPSGTDDDWQITVSPTELRGSRARNQIPDEAHCSLDIRFCGAGPPARAHGPETHATPPPSPASTAEKVCALVRSHLPQGCRLEPILATPPLSTDPLHPMVQRLKSIGEEVTGKEVPIGREHGATDARYFGAAGIPAFLYGVEGGGIHGAEEWVSLRSLLEHCAISRKLLREL